MIPYLDSIKLELLYLILPSIGQVVPALYPCDSKTRHPDRVMATAATFIPKSFRILASFNQCHNFYQLMFSAADPQSKCHFTSQYDTYGTHVLCHTII